MAKITKRLVAEALREKANPFSPYAKLPDFQGNDYEGPGGIYFWARRYFPDYNKLYPTNEEFTKYFVRDLNNKAPKLIESIDAEVKIAEAQVPIEAGVTTGETPGTMSGGNLPNLNAPRIPNITMPVGNLKPKTPVPEEITKAFENESAQTTNPDIKSSSAGYRKTATSTSQPIFQAPKIPSTTTNIAKNFGSSANVFIKKSSTRILNSLFTGVGKLAGGGLSTATPLLSKAGNGLISTMTRFTSQTSRLSASRGSLISPKKGALKWILGLVLFSFFGFSLFSAISSSSQQTSTAQASLIGSCPAAGRISAPYGFNIPDYPDVGNEGCGGLTKCHNAVDIAAIEGSLVKSTLDGTVTFVGSERFKGNYVEITDTTGLIATFEHLSNFTISLNTTVSKGTVIGAVGHTGEGVTGPVLHYKLRRNGVLLNPFKTLGSSSTLDPQALTSSDDIAQNNYLNRKSTDNAGYWGVCNS